MQMPYPTETEEVSFPGTSCLTKRVQWDSPRSRICKIHKLVQTDLTSSWAVGVRGRQEGNLLNMAKEMTG